VDYGESRYSYFSRLLLSACFHLSTTRPSLSSVVCCAFRYAGRGGEALLIFRGESASASDRITLLPSGGRGGREGTLDTQAAVASSSLPVTNGELVELDGSIRGDRECRESSLSRLISRRDKSSREFHSARARERATLPRDSSRSMSASLLHTPPPSLPPSLPPSCHFPWPFVGRPY